MQLKSCIYFVYCRGMIKIGQTAQCPRKRMAELQVGCPFPLEMAAIWRMSPRLLTKAERFLHQRFKDHQVLGEWFSVGPLLLKAAKADLVAHLGAKEGPVPAIVKNRRPRNGSYIDFDEMWDSIKLHINSDFHRRVLTSAAISKRFELAEMRRAINGSDDVETVVQDQQANSRQ